jgi:hypothetical protein
MGMGRVMNQGETLITSLVGRAIGYIGISRGQKAPTLPNHLPPGTDSGDLSRQLRVQSFDDYAKSHGRADLARAAQEYLSTDISLRKAASKYLESQYFGGVSNALIAKTSSLWNIGSALLMQLTLGLLVLIPLGIRRHLQAPAHRREVSAVDVASAVLPPLCAVAVCAWMIWVRRDIDWQAWQAWEVQTMEETSVKLPTSQLLALAVELAPIPFIALWCAAGAMWSRRRPRADRYSWRGARTESARAAGESSEAPRSSVLFQRVASAVLALGWIIVAVLGVAWLMAPNDNVRSMLSSLLPAEIVCVLALHLFLRRQATQRVTPDVAERAHVDVTPASIALERGRRALCWMTALAAVAWIGLATYSLPLRAEAQSGVDAFAQQGEMKMMLLRSGR